MLICLVFIIIYIAPGIVEIIDIISISDTALTVTWNPPIQPNGIITGYEVIYSVYEDDAENISIPVTSNIYSFNITDLCKLKIQTDNADRWLFVFI